MAKKGYSQFIPIPSCALHGNLATKDRAWNGGWVADTSWTWVPAFKSRLSGVRGRHVGCSSRSTHGIRAKLNRPSQCACSLSTENRRWPWKITRTLPRRLMECHGMDGKHVPTCPEAVQDLTHRVHPSAFSFHASHPGWDFATTYSEIRTGCRHILQRRCRRPASSLSHRPFPLQLTGYSSCTKYKLYLYIVVSRTPEPSVV